MVAEGAGQMGLAVAGEDLGPVAHVLIGGQDDRALLVPSAHQAEEEVRLLAVEGTEAHLVDDKERAVAVAPSLEPAGRDCRVPLAHMHQVIEHEVGGAEPVLDGLHAKRHGEVALPDTGRAHEERRHAPVASDGLLRETLGRMLGGRGGMSTTPYIL